MYVSVRVVFGREFRQSKESPRLRVIRIDCRRVLQGCGSFWKLAGSVIEGSQVRPTLVPLRFYFERTLIVANCVVRSSRLPRRCCLLSEIIECCGIEPPHPLCGN